MYNAQQQHLYNGLSRLQTTPFLYGNGLAQLWASPCWNSNRLAHGASHGHGWPMASMSHPVGELMLAQDIHRDGQW